jgi:hypothetical protein
MLVVKTVPVSPKEQSHQLPRSFSVSKKIYPQYGQYHVIESWLPENGYVWGASCLRSVSTVKPNNPIRKGKFHLEGNDGQCMTKKCEETVLFKIALAIVWIVLARTPNFGL